MDLVYEQDNVSFTLYYFLNYSLKSFLELSLVLGSCYEGTHVKGVHFAGLQVLRNVAVHNLHGYALRYGCLSHTRLANKYRVVLGPSAQDLEDPSYLVVSAYHRVELSFRGHLVQVDGVFAQKLIILFHMLYFYNQ